MATLTVLGRSDYPSRDASVDVSATATVGQLKEAIAKALTLGERSGAYIWFAISYAADVVELSGDDSQSIEGKVSDRSVVFARAPAELKPVTSRHKKKSADDKDKKKEEDDDDEEAKKFKGYTLKNAFERYRTDKNKKIALEYIDMQAKRLFKTPEFLKLPEETLVTFLKSETLGISEATLFTRVCEWGNAQLKAKGQQESKDALKAELKEILPLIRFPTMSTKQVATQVSMSGMLESNQILALFTYLGSKSAQSEGGDDEKKTIPDLPFIRRRRKQRESAGGFEWDPQQKNDAVNLSEKNHRASASGRTNVSVGSKKVLKSGRHRWEFELTGDTSAYMMCGVVPADSSLAGGSHIGDSTLRGWGLFTNSSTWSKYRMDSSTSISESTGTAGATTIGCVLDLKAGTLEFHRGGFKSGNVIPTHYYNDIVGPVRVAATFYSGEIILRGPKGAMEVDDDGGDDDEE